jgi:transaldolase
VQNQLEALKELTTVVADTGDFGSISRFAPQDATTNPSLILSASKQQEYAPLIEEAIYYGKKSRSSLSSALERVFFNFGREILKIIPGRVSIEVDSRLSFDAKESQQKAEQLIALFEKEKIDRERILIKLASTWEGILAAKELEKKKIHCNMTLLFCLPQAIAAGEAKATLISPFVGRILDWYKKKEGKDFYPAHLDPGVLSVTKIFHYYKKFGYKTQIMGASFRNKEEILALSGCDLLTISPKFLEELQNSNESVARKLDPNVSQDLAIEKILVDQKKFSASLKRDEMASEKLQEGIESFNKDTLLLENLLKEKL